MPARRVSYLLVAYAALISGCLARQVATDGNGIRHALVDMYTDQAFDNLVRSFENKPFVQLKYSMLSVKDTDDAMVTALGGESDFATNAAKDLTKVGAAQLTRATSFSGKLPVGFTGERDRVMTFHADPVIDQNFIYEEYLNFARDPGLFVVSDSKPCCAVHVCKKCGNKWYWVPAEAGPAFLQLIMKTSFAPPPSAPAEVYYDSSIASVERVDGRPFHFVLTLAKAVPDDEGIMQVVLKDGRKPWLPILRLNRAMQPGAPVTKVLTVYSDKTLPPDASAQLKGSAVLFFSRHFPNPNPKVASDNQKVLDALETIRLQLLRTNPSSP